MLEVAHGPRPEVVGTLGPAEFALGIWDKKLGRSKKRGQLLFERGGFVLRIVGSDHQQLVPAEVTQKGHVPGQLGGELEVDLGNGQDEEHGLRSYYFSTVSRISQLSG